MIKQAHEGGLLHHDLTHLALALFGVLAQRERDVVVQIHGAEQRAVLEEHAELAPHPVQVTFAHADGLLAVNPDLALVGPEEADDVLEENGFAGAGGAHDRRDATLGNVEADVLQDGVRAE